MKIIRQIAMEGSSSGSKYWLKYRGVTEETWVHWDFLCLFFVWGEDSKNIVWEKIKQRSEKDLSLKKTRVFIWKPY